MKRAASLLLCLVAIAAAGCGSTKETCESIDWQGGQCEALDKREMAKTMRKVSKALARPNAPNQHHDQQHYYLEGVP
jgi:outer membrane protein assembly factor BamE (lipoprotein component of BamABCDE complex)